MAHVHVPRGNNFKLQWELTVDGVMEMKYSGIAEGGDIRLQNIPRVQETFISKYRV